MRIIFTDQDRLTLLTESPMDIMHIGAIIARADTLGVKWELNKDVSGAPESLWIQGVENTVTLLTGMKPLEQ